jgi:hypothetical protein
MSEPQRKTELSDLKKADCKTGKMLGEAKRFYRIRLATPLGSNL